jgi:hypothetical protein
LTIIDESFKEKVRRAEMTLVILYIIAWGHDRPYGNRPGFKTAPPMCWRSSSTDHQCRSSKDPSLRSGSLDQGRGRGAGVPIAPQAHDCQRCRFAVGMHARS